MILTDCEIRVSAVPLHARTRISQHLLLLNIIRSVQRCKSISGELPNMFLYSRLNWAGL
jgi:hypothetical protein